MNCLIWLLSIILIPLSAIDTLMQSQPDSALTVLLDEPTDEPYYQLLLSEALYKNDYAQTNRDELLVAMAFFDSVQDPFLAARCHYMNGVGFYEMDSVVPACEEYMKAIQIMEEHYTEKELVGYKAKFMALTYTRLCVLFSDQYLHEQAIYFGKQALHYYHKYDAEPWHVAWVLDEIGSQYFMMKQQDSACYYFDRAIKILNNTNDHTYRDIEATRALVSYREGGEKQQSLKQLKQLLSQAEDRNEYLARCLSISEIFFKEKDYDSAQVYLDLVFGESDNTSMKKLSAEWLVEICKNQGQNPDVYTDFLVPFATLEENHGVLRSQFMELYKIFNQNNIERKHQTVIKEQVKGIILILAGLLFVIITLSFLLHRRKKQVGFLTNHFVEEQSLFNKRKCFELFLNEAICQEIILSFQGKTIKRSSVPQDYQELILNDAQLQQLAMTVNRYFGSFEKRLEQNGVCLNQNLINLCHLYLLGMDEKQAAILLNRDYSSIKRYEKKLKNGFNTQEDLRIYLKNIVLSN